jgi:hypothetical protein
MRYTIHAGCLQQDCCRYRFSCVLPNIEYADPHIMRNPAIAAYPKGT